MKFLIKNWGPIASAEIDLSKQLIVFTGPNGTGKTYFSYLLYGFMSSVGAIPYSIIQQKQDNRLYDVFHGDELEKGLPVQVEIKPSQIFDLFKEMLSGKFGKLVDFFDLGDISNNLSIKIISSAEDWSKWLFDTNLDMGIDLKVTKPSSSYTFQLTPKSDAKLNIPFEIAYLYHKLLFQGVFLPYMLTAERSGIYTFSKEIALGRLRDAKIASRYPRPINDSLVHAEDLANDKKYISDYAGLADQIESDILQGKMMITDDGDIKYQHDENIYSYHLSSSMVKTLSPIIFYLRHKAQDDLLLIIDEPEINLHPNNQILLAHVFARMINAGLHLLIATHSDYIIRELNNLVMFSELPKDKRIKFKYNANEILEKGILQPYYFNFGEKQNKVQVRPIEVSQTGFDVASIDDTIEKQNDIFQTLFYYLSDGSSELCK